MPQNQLILQLQATRDPGHHFQCLFTLVKSWKKATGRPPAEKSPLHLVPLWETSSVPLRLPLAVSIMCTEDTQQGKA